MPGIVLTFPILAGKVEAWRRFCQELTGSRFQQYEASRRRFGIARERMALVETAYGSTATTALESSDIGRMLAEMISSEWPFDNWYRDRVEDLHGVRLAGLANFAPTLAGSRAAQVLFEWSTP